VAVGAVAQTVIYYLAITRQISGCMQAKGIHKNG